MAKETGPQCARGRFLAFQVDSNLRFDFTSVVYTGYHLHPGPPYSAYLSVLSVLETGGNASEMSPLKPYMYVCMYVCIYIYYIYTIYIYICTHTHTHANARVNLRMVNVQTAALAVCGPLSMPPRCRR
jgi:hypothetical protein